ncbi:hypothetical protein SAMN05428944_2498 [Streptomyces sp. 1222.5]|uniref:hypothetical protein n=1 Tax=unclassified Streptomyces TaxID=2593676 RepID=UPI00089B7620|nr:MULTISPECIES: hypothetical protein [unclassified Streptomyces]PKW10316.1 hypothetical protein BX260_5593 [Streptomyces sp. 5112.2]SEC09271.1 hypothetical protein SAMN05428944_2498 [Streptomyces sp. 1222.5]
MRSNPVMRTLAAAVLAGGAVAGTVAVANPASAAVTTDSVRSLSPSVQTHGGCRFGAGFNRGFNNCGFGTLGATGFYPFAGYPYSSVPVVIIIR